MNLKITKQALKAFNQLDAKQYRQVVSSVIGLISNPLPQDSQTMQGAKNGERRIDVGEYRVIYAINGELIEILVVGKRNDDDVYKLWERMKK